MKINNYGSAVEALQRALERSKSSPHAGRKPQAVTTIEDAVWILDVTPTAESSKPSDDRTMSPEIQINVLDEELERRLRMPMPVGNTSTVLDLDGVVRIDVDLTHDAYALMKKDGYSGDAIVFNLGKAPDKYRNPESLPPIEYRMDSANSMVASIADVFMRDVKNWEVGGYSHVELTLHAPQGPAPSKSQTAVPEKNTLKIGETFDLRGATIVPATRSSEGDEFVRGMES